ncbi:hypothetical protein [Peptoanaerobacter stomatis]
MGKDKIHELVDIIDTENIEFIYNFLSNFIENIQNKNSDITKEEEKEILSAWENNSKKLYSLEELKKEIGLYLCTNK